MAQIPSIKSISKEAFPEETKEWIDVLLGPLNTFMTTTGNALQSALTFGDNILGQEYLLDFTYNSPSDLPQSFKNALVGARPGAVTIVSATEDGTPVAVVHAWQLTPTGNVEISNLIKLTTAGAGPLNPGSRYKIKFRSQP